MYAIIDIETTGGSPLYEKVTEIAIFVHDGTKVVDEFTTLINPEKDIPYYITGLTGITNEMVANAPKFYEVAKKIIELTDNKIFVAHNVNFDYNFIKTEFKNLGYNYTRECLCTVKLSRKLIPGHKSYSLGNICNDLNINLNDRHRAAGDAQATVKLFELLLDIKKQQGIPEFIDEDYGVLHPKFDKNILKSLPETPGIYYFYNDKNEVIYVGKSKNIKTRIATHFGHTKNKTALKMKKEIADISIEITGSELIALLLESEEIKKSKPLYNRTQRRAYRNYGIISFYNPDNYLCFSIIDNSVNGTVPLMSFENKVEAKKVLDNLVSKYNLCQKYCGLYQSQGSCFNYEVKLCQGACILKEAPESYNQRAEMALQHISYNTESMLIIDKGRNSDEKSVIKIKNGKYLGYGFIDTSCITSLEALDECINHKKDNHEVWQIIKTYLKKNKVERIINQ